MTSMIRRALRVARPLGVSVFFGLPLVSLLRHVTDAPAFTAIAWALAITSALQPALGLAVACVLIPCVHVLEAWLGAPASMQMTSALVFAFAAGAALRVASPRPGASDRLSRPALILAGLVLASALVGLAMEQASDRRSSVPLELWINLSDRYFFNSGPYADPHTPMLWLGALAFAAFAERALQAQPSKAGLVVGAWFVGGALAALPAVVWLVDALRASAGHSLARLVGILAHDRVSLLHPDVNAAGSYFALYLVAAIVLGAVSRRWWVVAAVGPLVTVAFLLAQSRAAIGAALFVLGVLGLRMLPRERRLAVAGIIVGLVAAAGLATVVWTRVSHAAPSQALAIRGDMTRVGLRMARDHPVFGIGLGQYMRASAPYITERLPALYRFAPDGENAHDNFLQILVELGLPALCAFVWMVVPPARPWRPWVTPPALAGESKAMAAGLATFLVSAIFGHPLLIPEVFVVFFLALGVSAGLMPSPPAPRAATRVLVWMGLAAVVVTLPWRLAAPFSAKPDVVGVGAVGGYIDAVEFRPIDQDSTWQVPSEADALNLPLRWAGPASAACEVQIRFDGRDGSPLRLSNEAWRPYRLELPSAGRGVAVRTLELHVSDPDCHLIAGPLRLELTR